MSARPAARRSHLPESGVTLIELIVAVVVMGIGFLVIVGGLGTAIVGADLQRRQAGADLALRSAAETLTYEACATAYTPVQPSGFAVVVTRVSHWDPAANRFDAALPASCTPPSGAPADNGLQLLDLTATSTAGRPTTETLQVVKRRP